MVFTRTYPKNYHGTVNDLNLRLFSHLMDNKQIHDLITSYGKKSKKPQSFVNQQQVECNDKMYLLDLSTLSCVTLEQKKNRFLQNDKGYYQYSFLGAKNILTNRKFAYFVSGSQITKRDLLTFKKLIENYLGYKIQFVTDNRHEHSLIAKKDVTMFIEVEFGGIKTKLYKLLKPLQYYKNNRIYTKLSFKSLVRIYVRRLKTCGFVILEPRRINHLTKQKILPETTVL